MTDDPVPAAPAEPEPEPALERARVEPSRTRGKWDFLPVLYLIGFLVLAGTVFFLWQNPPEAKLAPQEAGRVNTLQSQMDSLRDEVAQLQTRPQPPPGPSQADFAALQQQVTALTNRPQSPPEGLGQLTQQVQALASRQPPDLGPVEGRVQALEQQVQALANRQPDLGPLEQRVQALEQRPQFDPAALDRQFGQVTAQIQQLGGQVQQLASRTQDATGKLGQTVDQLQGRVDALEKQQTAIAHRAQLAARLQGAAAALAAGQKLGDIPGAPPALARFANEAPPTEAALRQSFDKYAAAAEKASQPAITDNQDFGSRMWTRAQQALTVRQGDRVLLGDPIAGVVTHAREQLDSGDLAGALNSLKGLAGPAAQAMRPWTEAAQSLLDARAAIASMAAS